MNKPANQRWISQRSVLLIPLATGLLLRTIGALAQGQDDEAKVLPNPDVGLSDAQRESSIAQLKARNAAWVEDFVAEGRDPRLLPVADLQTWSAGAATPEEARGKADAMIEGEVVWVTYVPSSDGLTKSLATVKVSRVAKGELPAVLVVRQIGGPAWSPEGGDLQQLEGDPLLLPRQHVFLLMRLASGEAVYQTVYGAGVYLVTDKGIQAPHSNAFASLVNGLTVAEALMVPQ